MPILNYTTKIRADRTVGEIQKMLASNGAQSITTDYTNGRIAAVVFTIDVLGQSIEYRLPCNVDGVLAALKKQKVARAYQQYDHAESVAWRIVRDWVSAQLALIEAGQAQMSEVFLPYALLSGTKETVYQLFMSQKARGLLNSANV